MIRTFAAACIVALCACGDNDGGGNPSDQLLVGAECATDDDCLQSRVDGGFSEQCLTQFKGGYCGIEDCTTLDDCPAGSACVAHTDGHNYCFRLCIDKPECNVNRTPDDESTARRTSTTSVPARTKSARPASLRAARPILH